MNKAERLLEGGKVFPTDARVFAVEGDRGTYLVVIGDLFTFCTCPAHVAECSHVLAARMAADRLARVPVGPSFEQAAAAILGRDDAERTELRG